MEASDKKAFSEAIAALALSFDKEAGKPFFAAYWLGLSDLTIEAVQSAVALAIRQCEFMPKPVDLRRLAGEQTNDQRALAAWNDVLRAVPLGAYKHVDFADKIINAAIRNLGGWPGLLGRFDGSEGEKWARIEFLKTYEALAASGVNGDVCAALPGLAQLTSIGGQVQAPAPVRIECDAQRAKLSGSVSRPAISKVTDVPKIDFKRA